MRVVFYDTTSGFLSRLWALGAWLALVRGHADRVIPVASWEELLEALRGLPLSGGASSGPRSLASVQVWGHGAPARPLIDAIGLDSIRLANLSAIMQTKFNPRGLSPIWVWRSCAVFAGPYGRGFADRCAKALGCRVAGFTHNIGWWWGLQSGMHVLAPGASVDWPEREGLDAKGRPLWSSFGAPGTIFCLARGPE